MSYCEHTTRTLGRTIDAIGRSMLWERCDTCGKNANGPGYWVSKDTVYDETVLPVFRDNRDTATKESASSLF